MRLLQHFSKQSSHGFRPTGLGVGLGGYPGVEGGELIGLQADADQRAQPSPGPAARFFVIGN